MPDAQPLVERLGKSFFHSLPQRPGVYLMRGAGEVVLYVGKAKNLRNRLSSYRVANPENMARRTLRLLRLVTRIELEECDDEQEALRREAELLRTLMPRFNRAGKWAGKPRFLAWKGNAFGIELIITEAAQAGWTTHGPLGGGASYLVASLARVLWLAVNRTEGVERLPVGWMEERVDQVQINIENSSEAGVREILEGVETMRRGDVDGFKQWFENQRAISTVFERTWLEAEFQSLREWFKPPASLSG